jgi:DNA-binding NtrC family response regulator
MCRVDAASSFEEGKEFLENNYYDVAVLDIMGVKGYELLEIAKTRNVPTLMLTAHALTEKDLLKSAQDGASYYVPKTEINDVGLFIADVFEAQEKGKSSWVKWFERLGVFCDRKFEGTDWREKQKEFWEKKTGIRLD